MAERWFVVIEDTIGGYAISNKDKPVSMHDWRQGDIVVGEFVSKEIAEYIARMHNLRLDIERMVKDASKDGNLPRSSGIGQDDQS